MDVEQATQSTAFTDKTSKQGASNKWTDKIYRIESIK
jgi:hypothetical protein